MLLNVGVSVRHVMESAVACGFSVQGVDFFGDVDAQAAGPVSGLCMDLGQEASVASLLAVAAQRECTGLVYTSGPENRPQLLQPWEDQGKLLGNGPASLQAVRDYRQLGSSLAGVDLHLPETLPLDLWDQRRPGRSYLLKPTFRGSGHGVRFLPEGARAARLLPQDQSEPGRYIIQEYISGTPASMTFLAGGNQALVVGTSRQIIFEGHPRHPFCYQGNISPLLLDTHPLAARLSAQLTAAASRLTADFGLRGLNTLDFILEGEVIRPLELNPRWSASVEVLEQQLGQPMYELHFEACQGRLPSALPQPRPGCYGKLIVYPPRPIPISRRAGEGWRDLYSQGLRDLPRPGQTIMPGQPLCTVLARGETSADCLERLRKKARQAWQDYLELAD